MYTIIRKHAGNETFKKPHLASCFSSMVTNMSALWPVRFPARANAAAHRACAGSNLVPRAFPFWWRHQKGKALGTRLEPAQARCAAALALAGNLTGQSADIFVTMEEKQEAR